MTLHLLKSTNELHIGNDPEWGSCLTEWREGGRVAPGKVRRGLLGFAPSPPVWISLFSVLFFSFSGSLLTPSWSLSPSLRVSIPHLSSSPLFCVTVPDLSLCPFLWLLPSSLWSLSISLCFWVSLPSQSLPSIWTFGHIPSQPLNARLKIVHGYLSPSIPGL